MLDSKTLMQIVNSQLDAGKAALTKDSITLGVVVDGDDPLQNGRLRVYCPNLNDDPKKLHHLPWAVCASPFAGTTSNDSFTRGAGKGSETTSGPVAYGFWGVPEQGAIVLVARIDGDERRRVWLGCLHSHQETHSALHGRYKWKDGDGTPDGPLSSTCDPIQPMHENALKAFLEENDSAEWKTRQAEYQACAIPRDGGIPAEGLEDYLDDTAGDISEAEEDKWVKPILGAHGYDWSSNKALGEFMQSKVYGFSTPGFHALSMDDRAYNNRIRLRSATGHQLIFDDTNERIYLATNEGNNWIEFDSNGNIDIYSKRRVSVRAEDDINFSTDKSFRVKAKEGIYMYSGDTREQEKLDDNKPEAGEIRFHSTADTHMFSEKNMRVLVKEDFLEEIGKNSYTTVGEEMFQQVESGINTIVNDGNNDITINGDYNHYTSGDTSIFAGNDIKLRAVSDAQMFAYTGKIDIGSQLQMTIKAVEGDFTMEAVEKNMKMMSNEGNNQITMRNPFFNIFSTGSVVTQSAQEVASQVYSGFGVTSSNEPTIDGSPFSGGCARINAGVNVSFKPSEINMDAVNDIYMKVQDGISDFTGKTDLAVSGINKNLEQLEDKVNDLVYTTWDNFNTLVSSWLDPLPDGFSLPALPSFPSPPSLAFPAINLPEFNFDFCIDTGDLLNIDNFNPISRNLFGELTVDLGEFTVNNIKDWADRHVNKIERSVDRIQSAANLDPNIDSAIVDIRFSVAAIEGSLNNLLDVNLTGNAGYHNDYTLGINGFNNDIVKYNTAVEQYNALNFTSLETLDDLSDEVNSHYRSASTVNKLVQTNPSDVTAFDFSGLTTTYTMYQQYSNDLDGINV